MKNFFTRKATERDRYGEEEEITMLRLDRIVVAAALASFLFVTLCCSFARVDTGCTGVVKAFSAPTGKTMSNGLHLKVPFYHSVEEVDTQITKVEAGANAVTKDLQSVSTTVAVNYQISAGSAVEIVRQVGAKYLQPEIIEPAIQEMVKAETAKYTAEELIVQRANVSAGMADALQKRIEKYGIKVCGFNVINFSFSDQFNKAIEAKQVAIQQLIKSETDQKKKVVIAKSDAEVAVVKAKAREDAARANAAAVLIAAKAQAEANQQLAQSVTPNLVEYEKIKKWDGKMPQVSGGNSIIDIRP